MIALLDLPGGLQVASLWVFAALPPAVLNYMVAEQYQQEPPHAVASLVLLSNLGSLVVMPLCWAWYSRRATCKLLRNSEI